MLVEISEERRKGNVLLISLLLTYFGCPLRKLHALSIFEVSVLATWCSACTQ